MITTEQKQALQAKGYSVEDVGAVWGDEWAGEWRWLNDKQEGDGFGVIQYSEEDAWSDAAQYDILQYEAS